MSTSKRNSQYYCIVPYCRNTTVTTPHKIFLSVPKDGEKREIWAKAMKRTSILSTKTSHKCCEDHFTLEEDLENYWRWKLTGEKMRLHLKKGVVPHIFKCQDVNMVPVESKRIANMQIVQPPKKRKLFSPRKILPFLGGVESTTKTQTWEIVTAKSIGQKNKEGTIPEVFPSCSSKSTSPKNACVASKAGQKVSNSQKVLSPKKTDRTFKSEIVTEATTVIKQESTDEPSTLAIDNVISVKELASSNATAYFPDNAMPVVNSDLTSVDETSVITKPVKSKRLARYMKIRNFIRKVNEAKLRRFASESKISQGVNESFITIKQEPVESTDEAPPLVIENVLSVKELLPSNSSSSFPDIAMSDINSDLTNVGETSVTTEPRIIRKRIVRSMYTNNSTRKAIQAKLHRRSKSSVSLNRSKMSQCVIEPSITIKQEPLESIKDAPSLFIDNVLSMKEHLPSNSTLHLRTKSSVSLNRSVAEPSITIKQEPLESINDAPPLSIDNVLSMKEHLPSNSSLHFSDNVMLVVNQDETKVDEPSVTTKPRLNRKERIARSMYTSNSPRKATQAKLQRFAKSSMSSSRDKMLQSVTEPSITINEEPAESTNEVHPPVMDNVLSVKELLPSNSSLFFPDNVLPVANPDLTNEDETSFSNKSERKINIVKPYTSNSTPSVKQAKLDLLAHSPMLSKKICGTNESSGRSISPTEATRNATKEIFLSMMNGSGKHLLSGSGASEKPGDLFDVFANFIADKLRGLHWDTCAVALRTILDIVFKAGEVEQSSSDDDEEIDISNSNTNSSPPSDEC